MICTSFEYLDPQNGFIAVRSGACSEFQDKPFWKFDVWRNFSCMMITTV